MTAIVPIILYYLKPVTGKFLLNLIAIVFNHRYNTTLIPYLSTQINEAGCFRIVH